jgi:hypothetical protein
MSKQAQISGSTQSRPRFFRRFLALLTFLLVATFCFVRIAGSTSNGPIVAINFQTITTNVAGTEKVAVFELRNLRGSPVEIDSFCVWELAGGKDAQPAAIANRPQAVVIIERSRTTSIHLELPRQWPARAQFICRERRSIDRIRATLPSPLKNLISSSRREPIFSDWVTAPQSETQR